MPWRQNPSPYHTWISEMMLQQTQVATVIDYFNRFIALFPDVTCLAKADQQSVLKAWEGLGYYSRARNLHRAAQILVSDYDGQLPSDYHELQVLPGIGPYIAAAISSIAFQQPVPVVDGNVLRVFTRFWFIETDIRKPVVRDQIFERLSPILHQVPPEDFNQAIMELGALCCRPVNPSCDICPIQGQCQAFEQDQVHRLPYKSKKEPVPHHTIGVGVIIKDGKVLIGKRKESQMLGGLWEFPGGKMKPNEEITQTIEREIREETALEVQVDGFLCQVKHAYTHFKITMHAYLCTMRSGTPTPISCDELQWVSLSELDQYPFPKANHTVLAHLKQID